MLVHTDHLVPGMRLEKDIELRAGSALLTRRDLSDGVLDEKVIEAIRKFAEQIVPVSHRVYVEDDQFAIGYLRSTINTELTRVTKAIASGKDYPNFLDVPELEEKVLRVMEALLSNPDVVRLMYEARFSATSGDTPVQLLIDHSFRTAMLAVALAVKLGGTMFSLSNLGLAALLHDLSLLETPYFSGVRSLDDLGADELEAFVGRHQIQSALFFSEKDVSLSPYQKGEVLHMLANHHRPNLTEQLHRNTLVLHFADLLDEMISNLPHKVRYCFGPLHHSGGGRRLSRRSSMLNVLSVLAELSRVTGWQARQIITGLAELFGMSELMQSGYSERLREIIDWCPFDSAAAWPSEKSNSIPRSIWCSRSRETGFECKHMIFTKIEIQQADGSLLEYNKCGELGPHLQRLNSGEN